MTGAGGARCWDVEPLSKEEVQALKSLYRGDAQTHQQRLALQVIINKFGRMSQPAFVPGDPGQSAFLAGRQFVALQITDCINRPLGQLVYADQAAEIDSREESKT